MVYFVNNPKTVPSAPVASSIYKTCIGDFKPILYTGDYRGFPASLITYTRKYLDIERKSHVSWRFNNVFVVDDTQIVFTLFPERFIKCDQISLIKFIDIHPVTT